MLERCSKGGELGGDRRAEVAALGEPAGVAETGHQDGPGPGGPGDVPPGFGGVAGEPEAGQARDDDVVGVLGGTAVRLRVGQRTDGVAELEHRSGPAMGQQQGAGVGDGGADVDEVDLEAVDGGRELTPAVQQRFGPAPVVVAGPVGDEPADLRQWGVPGVVSSTVSGSGHRVCRRRCRRSSRAASGMCRATG